ncbi:class F sortase [Streptomyces triticagri]|uniref:Class F sortase n=1 Tax=Streptomyces triticagri TaxID=2293568 RepID=A0A372M3V8_9ACTN|nr:class F sortase [Streptomyces triticagri]
MTEGVRAQDGPPRPAAAQAGEQRAGTAKPMAPARPLRIRIPSIQVDAPMTGLGLAPDGRLDVPPPDRPESAGWFAGGTTPGARGTAVTVGHLDSATGPAVFFRLGALQRGDTIEVDRDDGSTAVFTVEAVELHDGDTFPDEKVYGQARRPELRVITCGGTYSRAEGTYSGNTVVYAGLTAST